MMTFTMQRAYTRCETDDEFRERVRAKHGRYVSVKRERLTAGSWYSWRAMKESYTTTEDIDTLSGVALDDAVWYAHKMQRKILEVYP